MARGAYGEDARVGSRVERGVIGPGGRVEIGVEGPVASRRHHEDSLALGVLDRAQDAAVWRGTADTEVDDLGAVVRSPPDAGRDLSRYVRFVVEVDLDR